MIFDSVNPNRSEINLSQFHKAAYIYLTWTKLELKPASAVRKWILTSKVKVGPPESVVTSSHRCHNYKKKLSKVWKGLVICAQMKRAGRKLILASIVFRHCDVGTHSINLTLSELQGLFRLIVQRANSKASVDGNINNYCKYKPRDSEKLALGYRGIGLAGIRYPLDREFQTGRFSGQY